MLQTNLTHIQSQAQLDKLVQNNAHVMICCGRMASSCVPVYNAMEALRPQYPNVQFCDMAFDLPEASCIRSHPACRGFNELPFTVYFRDGQLVKATCDIQSRQAIQSNLDEYFQCHTSTSK